MSVGALSRDFIHSFPLYSFFLLTYCGISIILNITAEYNILSGFNNPNISG